MPTLASGAKMGSTIPQNRSTSVGSLGITNTGWIFFCTSRAFSFALLLPFFSVSLSWVSNSWLTLFNRFLHVGDPALAAGAQGGELLFDRGRVVRDLNREVVELPAEHVAKPPDHAQRQHDYRRDRRNPGQAAAFQDFDQRGQDKCQHDRQRHRDQHRLAVPENSDEQRKRRHIQQGCWHFKEGRPLRSRHRGVLQPTQQVCRSRFVLPRAAAWDQQRK